MGQLVLRGGAALGHDRGQAHQSSGGVSPRGVQGGSQWAGLPQSLRREEMASHRQQALGAFKKNWPVECDIRVRTHWFELTCCFCDLSTRVSTPVIRAFLQHHGKFPSLWLSWACPQAPGCFLESVRCSAGTRALALVTVRRGLQGIRPLGADSRPPGHWAGSVTAERVLAGQGAGTVTV